MKKIMFWWLKVKMNATYDKNGETFIIFSIWPRLFNQLSIFRTTTCNLKLYFFIQVQVWISITLRFARHAKMSKTIFLLIQSVYSLIHIFPRAISNFLRHKFFIQISVILWIIWTQTQFLVKCVVWIQNILSTIDSEFSDNKKNIIILCLRKL